MVSLENKVSSEIKSEDSKNYFAKHKTNVFDIL